MPYLYLVHHGQTDANNTDAELVRSWKDFPPNEQGIKEAQNVGDTLKNKPIGAIYHDGSARAKSTAHILKRFTDAPTHQTELLRDWNLGHLAGKPVSEAQPQITHFQKHPDVPVPGGESYNEFYDRYSQALISLAHMTNNSPHDIAAVVHSKHFAATPSILSEGSAPVDSKHIPKNGSIWPIRVAKDRYSIEPQDSLKPEEQ